MKTIIITLLILAFAASGFAQLSDEARIRDNSEKYSMGTRPALSPFSLIDLSRVRWSNSYSVNFFSGGNYSGSSGLLNSSIYYEFSSKLSMNVNVGVYHNLGSLTSNNQNSDMHVLPGFNLNYHPSENFYISIGMQTYHGNQNPYSLNPYRYNPNSYLFPAYYGRR